VNSQGILIAISFYFARKSPSSIDVQGTWYERHSTRAFSPLPYAYNGTCLKRNLNATWNRLQRKTVIVPTNQIQVAELKEPFLQHKKFRSFAVPLQAGSAVMILRTTGCEALLPNLNIVCYRPRKIKTSENICGI